MMDITLYVTMDFLPDAQLRDYCNNRLVKDPVYLTIGVPARLNIVLFKSRDTGTDPYPLPEGITSWIWAVDRDFDQSTTPLIEGDNAQITATETDAETRIIVPVTTYAESLSGMLGDRDVIGGFTGELTGYNSSGDTIFCLQLEDVAVRNRIS